MQEKSSTPKITIPIKSLYGRRLFVSPSWVSNGDWAVRKDVLAEPYLWASTKTAEAVVRRRCEVEWAEDAKFEKLLPADPKALSPWHRTMWVWGDQLWSPPHGTLSRLFREAGGSRHLWLDEWYAKMFGLERVYADHPEHAVYDATTMPSVILMPMRAEYDAPPVATAASAAARSAEVRATTGGAS